MIGLSRGDLSGTVGGDVTDLDRAGTGPSHEREDLVRIGEVLDASYIEIRTPRGCWADQDGGGAAATAPVEKLVNE